MIENESPGFRGLRMTRRLSGYLSVLCVIGNEGWQVEVGLMHVWCGIWKLNIGRSQRSAHEVGRYNTLIIMLLVVSSWKTLIHLCTRHDLDIILSILSLASTKSLGYQIHSSWFEW